MSSLKARLLAVFGRSFDGDEMVMMFSVRLDETGTDGRFPYTVVGGAVSTVEGWQKLEVAWRAMLATYGVSAFHSKEFDGRSGEFAGWSDARIARFTTKRDQIMERTIAFRVAVGINREVHADVKKRMKGIKGFRGDSDYSLCLRWLLFHSCDALDQLFGENFGSLSAILEDGPYSSGAVDVFHHVRAMTGPRRPAKYAHKLGDIAVLGKGSPSLQAADAIVGLEAKRMLQPSDPQGDRLTLLLEKPQLETWYEGMIAEKERRRAYNNAKMAGK